MSHHQNNATADNSEIRNSFPNWHDWMTFEGHQTWHFLRQIMQSEEFPYLLSTHFLKQVWVILNGRNNKRLEKWIIMAPTNLIKKCSQIVHYTCLQQQTISRQARARKPTCWIIQPYIPSPFQPFQISAPWPHELLKHIQKLNNQITPKKENLNLKPHWGIKLTTSTTRSVLPKLEEEKRMPTCSLSKAAGEMLEAIVPWKFPKK